MTGSSSFIMIAGQRVLLRDPRVEDIHVRLRWSTVDTAWEDWDAPWEGKGLTPPGEAMRIDLTSTRISWPLPIPRRQLWVQAINGPLLGWVNSYHYDPDARLIWAGVDICESSCWGRGLGTEAFRLWMDYQFVRRDINTIRTGTWSGNVRMIRVAEKCGFSLMAREAHKREVRGAWYAGLVFECTRQTWSEWKGKR
jgi:RimJ/RimL family protein N-acetyltransferase